MKKQFITLGALLVMTSGLYAITANDVLQKFNISFGTIFGQGYLFNKAIAATQNKNLIMWNETIGAAKEFVIDNSKNLIGIKDADLLNAMAAIEKANMDLVNAIAITRSLSKLSDLQIQRNLFTKIETDIKILGLKVENINFILSNKKEAQRIVVATAAFVESAANKARKDITNNLLAPTALSPMPPVEL